MTEPEAMARALELAWKGWGRVSPNPMVGAVLLKDGRVVGEGYHAEFGGVHGEVAALESCADPSGATCVVTLEPCAHQGKTPPCTEALIRAGVRRVVAALRDPNPVARGGGEALRKAGVEVEFGLKAREAAALNAAFLWNCVRPDLPFVALKVATSLDGYLADFRGRSQWISGPEAREFVHWLRAGFDAIAVGRRTADSDDPLLTVRGSVVPRTTPRRIIFARSGGVRRDLRLVQTAREVPTWVVVDSRARSVAEAELAGTGVEIIVADGLREGLAELKRRGIGSLLVEGGATLASALLHAGLVDRFYWIQAPRWLGRGMPAFAPRDPLALGDSESWVVTERRTLGEDTLLVVDRSLCLPES